MFHCLENVKFQNSNCFQFYYDSNKKALTQVSDISKYIFLVNLIITCVNISMFSPYNLTINSRCCISVCGVFERTLVQESRYALLHYPMSSFPYCHKTKENLRQYKFSMCYVFCILTLLVPLLYFNDLFHMH